MSPVETSNINWAAVGIGMTFFAVLVALFKEEIVRIWRRPKLSATIHPYTPDCLKTMITYHTLSGEISNAACYYFRLWVENKGNQRADKVQVFAEKLYKLSNRGRYQESTKFLPLNLKWSHAQQNQISPEIFADGISPFMGKHCDLGHIIDPKFRKQLGIFATSDKSIFELDTEVIPNTLSNYVEPGKYHLKLRIAASNSKPILITLKIDLTGEWFDDEELMLSRGMIIKQITTKKRKPARS
jgi:hypothetical protein